MDVYYTESDFKMAIKQCCGIGTIGTVTICLNGTGTVTSRKFSQTQYKIV
jgi:hypothetical protein